MPESVDFVVGNSYKSIPSHTAKRSNRSGNLKTHDVVVFLDIISGDPDVIEKVSFDLGPTFDPSTFICNTPVRTNVNGLDVWRFSTRQQVYGAFEATIKIRGAGGTTLVTTHEISLNANSESVAYHRRNQQEFVEYKRLRPLPKTKLPSTSKFGIELELTSATYLLPSDVAIQLEDSKTDVVVIENYSAGRATSDSWKIVPDSSIMCSVNNPSCNTFELVSPPLWSGEGLSTVNGVLKRMGQIHPRLKVNKSMGFHVHIDVSGFSTSQLIKICQQFVKYEEVIDLLMPKSRRTGSSESNQFFQSNRNSVYYGATNRQIHDALEACYDTEELVNMMNRDGRYYKLNMQNLVSGRQPTLEFRQHSATMNYEKVASWVRFCILFIHNSARLRSPTPFAEGSSMEKKISCLFQFVIKDRALRDFYMKRMQRLATPGTDDDDDCACCSDCVASMSGNRCDSKLA